MTFVPQVAPVLTQNYGKQPDNSDTNAGPMIVAIQDGSMPRAKKQNGIGIAYDAPMYTLDGHGAHAVAHAVTTHQAKDGDPTTDNYVVTHTLSANGADASEDGTGRGTPLVTAWVGSYGGGGGAASEVAPTLQASGGEDERGVRNPIIVDLAQVTSPGNYSNPQPGDPCHPLTSAANQSVVAFNWQSGGDQRLGLSAERTTALGTSQTPAIAFSSKDSGNDAGDIAPTLRAMPHDTSHSNGGGQVAVAFTQNQNGDVLSGDVMHALSTNGNATGRNSAKVATTTVRRLTPTECARLQGFPDDWLNTTPPLSDSAKYRMLGNAVCVNVAEWLGKRIAEVLR